MKYITATQTVRTLPTLAIIFGSIGLAQDLIPPSVPIGLTATVATCGQVNLSWNASIDNTGGSGMKAYIINRSDGVNTTIGSTRTTFSDTKYVGSAITLTYNVVAMDNAGNKSAGSNSVIVSTPVCLLAPAEVVVDGAALFEPLGKAIATYGTRSALVYIKQNQSNGTWDTWIAVTDSDTGQTYHFLLHASPGYYQRESDYVFTSATDFWTLSWDSSNSGKMIVSQYKLNGSPPNSASLVSTKSLGDTNSFPQSLIRLQSGALMAAWNEYSATNNTAQDLTTGFAYHSPAGVWSVKFPVTVPNATLGNATLTQMALAQHPADRSIWAFEKRDGFYELGALHFTETVNDFTLDWVNATYINPTADGNNSPEGEFPYLAASADPTRNVILLAYQNEASRFVYVDSFTVLKEAPATIAQVQVDGSKTFISSPIYMERAVQFGMSVLSDGTIWLAYTPVNHQTLTGNEVYASNYFNNAWSAPVLVGYDYGNFYSSGAMRDPGVLIYRNDQPQVAFVAPDRKVHTFTLGSTPAPADTTPPSTSITSPASGATVSGVVSVLASASDNITATKVNLLIDGTVKSTATAAPYTFSWDTSTAASGNHTLQTIAYDAAGNTGSSSVITVSVPLTPPITSITTPSNNATVSGMVSVSATASSNVAKMDFLVDGTVKSTKSGAPYSFSWDTTKSGNGNHTLTTVAYDAAGLTGSSAPVTDMVANDVTPPVVAITSPANGAAVLHSSTVAITSTATDNVGVTKVEFYVNNTLAATDSATPYTYSWKVPAKKGASYTIKVIAYDAAGNTSPATFTVTSQ